MKRCPSILLGFDGGDRTTIELPETQQQLVAELAAIGKPIVVVLMNGSAIALNDTEKRASAILEAWYPGQAGGTAITETLFGENNPAGRLPLTFYASTEQLMPFGDYSMRNRTYRYFQGQPLYRFGYGLTYSKFSYSKVKLSSKKLRAGKPLKVKAKVQNTSERDGDEVVEVYLIPNGIADAPLRELVAFQRVHLKAGEKASVHFALDSRSLSLVDAQGIRGVQRGEYDVFVGGGPPQIADGQTASFQITGNTLPVSE